MDDGGPSERPIGESEMAYHKKTGEIYVKPPGASTFSPYGEETRRYGSAPVSNFSTPSARSVDFQTVPEPRAPIPSYAPRSQQVGPTPPQYTPSRSATREMRGAAPARVDYGARAPESNSRRGYSESSSRQQQQQQQQQQLPMLEHGAESEDFFYDSNQGSLRGFMYKPEKVTRYAHHFEVPVVVRAKMNPSSPGTVEANLSRDSMNAAITSAVLRNTTHIDPLHSESKIQPLIPYAIVHKVEITNVQNDNPFGVDMKLMTHPELNNMIAAHGKGGFTASAGGGTPDGATPSLAPRILYSVPPNTSFMSTQHVSDLSPHFHAPSSVLLGKFIHEDNARSYAVDPISQTISVDRGSLLWGVARTDPTFQQQWTTADNLAKRNGASQVSLPGLSPSIIDGYVKQANRFALSNVLFRPALGKGQTAMDMQFIPVLHEGSNGSSDSSETRHGGVHFSSVSDAERDHTGVVTVHLKVSGALPYQFSHSVWESAFEEDLKKRPHGQGQFIAPTRLFMYSGCMNQYR